MTSRRLVALLGVLCTTGCAVATASDPTGVTSAAITDGTPATSYPEAALVDLLSEGQQFAACSGAVIAPQVVLTAGHCIGAATDWNVTTPYATGQTVHASSGAVYDYHPPTSEGTESVDPNLHDIGLVFLDQPIELVQYPVVADGPVELGTLVRNIGRVDDGVVSTTDLFYGQTVQLFDGTPYGYPYDYAAEDIIESGDSGGPVELTTAHVVVAVNSGGGGPGGGNGGVEVLARVDLVSQWIQAQIQVNGGGGADAGAFNADYAATQDQGYDWVADAGQGSTNATSQGNGAGQGMGYGCQASRGTDAGGGGGAMALGLLGLLVARRRLRITVA